MIDIANSEARYLALLHRQMMKQLERELAPLNLGPGRYLYLFGLYIRDGRRQQDLADTIGVDKAAATRALSRLEACGYVSRRADKGDGRAMLVYLTPKGRELRSELEAAASHCIENLTRELAEQERQELRRLLAKMALPLTAQ
ncbi:MAG: MarR family transcriptional regulator [Pseudomonadales bacterium]|nr:MarR family transcriptional regulator [Halioglobus sp.]MCP5128895.1 MarR family transcriptional regulator [Pseudomonadales bacterium]